MITVQIGEAPARSLRDASEGWITEQIRRRQQDGRAVCVTIDVEAREARVVLATRDCPSSGGGGRMPNPLEGRIIELWNERVAHKRVLEPGTVISFLKQLEGLV